MLTVGDPFPPFTLQAVTSLEKGHEFQTLTRDSHPDKWKVTPAIPSSTSNCSAWR